jgi:adenosylmethionine---8-amino-7-oxononanoate aminotransferase
MIVPVDTNTLPAADKTHVWHPFTQMQDWCAPDHEPLVLVEGSGARLRDSHGREYLDGNASIWTNIHGHRHPRITQAIRDQLDRVAHVSFLGTTNESAIRLAERLTGLFPPQTLTRVFYTDDGSTAVEAAVKMSLQYWQLVGRPERRKFVAFAEAYHGDTVGAASLGGVSVFTERFAAVHFPVVRVTSAAELAALDPTELAGVIIEPLVQGAAGIRVWPDGMLREIRQWCDHVGVHLLLDEVLTGFGRTGTLFACQQEEVIPDFLCLAKGLTGGYLPLAATLTREPIFAAFLGSYAERKTFFYGHSYCGNALGCAAALANLEVFAEERTLESLPGKIALVHDGLAALRAEVPWVYDVRQRGLITGIEVRHPDGTPFPWTDQTGARICLAARTHGLLTRPILDTVTFIPPLSITADEISAALAALRAGIETVTARARPASEPKPRLA